MLGKLLQGCLERFPCLQQFTAQGDPHLCLQHSLLNTCCWKIFLWEGKSMTDNGLTWSSTSSALACFNLEQDGNPGWTRLGCLPSPLSLPHPHCLSIYSGVTFPRYQPSATGLSRQRFLPLQLHPGYSLLPRQGHANHCYLGCITAPTPEQRGLLYRQASAVQPFPAPSHLNHRDPKIPAQGRGWQRRAGNRACCALAVTALLASSAPLSQQTKPSRLRRVGSDPAMAGACSCLSGWQGCGRRAGMPGDAPSWVSHHCRSSRAALLPRVWQQGTARTPRDRSRASACLNNDIFRLTPAEMFAFCSLAPQCFN